MRVMRQVDSVHILTGVVLLGVYQRIISHSVITRVPSREIFEVGLHGCESTMPESWCLDSENIPRFVDEGKDREKIRHFTHGRQYRLVAPTLNPS